MDGNRLLNRQPERGDSPERDSLWRLPRATTRLVVLAAETQDGIDQGLTVADCFESNRQYWLQLDGQVKSLVSSRFNDDNFRRLGRIDKRLIEDLDGIKLDFFGGMIFSWSPDENDSSAPLPPPVEAPQHLSGHHEQPWPSQSMADVISRRQHRFNLAVKTDYDHLWSDWLVSSTRIHPLQVGYDNYGLQLAEFQDAITSTKALMDELHSQEYLEMMGAGSSLIEKQLDLLNRTTARAQGVYTRAKQLG